MPEYFFSPADAAAFRPDKMAKVNLFESPRLFCDVYGLEPGQEQRAHTHNANDKIYYVLSGRPSIRVGEEEREVAAGGLAIAPAGAVHGVVNRAAERATLLVIMAPHPGMKEKCKVRSEK